MQWDRRSYGCGSPSITSDAGVQIGILFTQLHLAVNEQHLSRRWTEVWLAFVGKVMWTALEFLSWQKLMTLRFFLKYLFSFFLSFEDLRTIPKSIWLAGGERIITASFETSLVWSAGWWLHPLIWSAVTLSGRCTVCLFHVSWNVALLNVICHELLRRDSN